MLAECSEEELVQSALVKIEQDSSNFSTFVTMLHDTPGLIIADVVEERMRELGKAVVYECWLLPWLLSQYFDLYAGGSDSSPSGGKEL